MESHEGHTHYVKKVVLPSGQTIEVVYFKDADDMPPVDHGPVAEPEQDLHVCLECSSELVYPVEWEEAGTTHWEVTLRCPNCEWAGTGVFEQQAVERFDEELDRGTVCLVRDLKRLMTANMEEEIDRFIEALDESRARALELVAAAKRELPDLPQRRALELVADGVVERYS